MFELLLIRIKTAFFEFVQFWKVLFRYYRNFSFFKADAALYSLYLFSNPFSISKKYHQKKRSKEIYVYGETPLTTFDRIIQEAKVKKDDHVFDLGCGRGRLSFWLSEFFGCRATGIDYIPEYIDSANRVKRALKIDHLNFLCSDILSADFTEGNVFYLYNTFLDDSTLTELGKKLDRLPKGTKVISVSFPITGYTSEYSVLKCFPAEFSWGWGDVFISVKD